MKKSSPKAQPEKGTDSAPKDGGKSKSDRREERRIRNQEHTKRYKERVKSEPLWMEIQFKENEDRIIKLEKEVKSLSKELETSSSAARASKSGSSSEKRPQWFGEPF